MTGTGNRKVLFGEGTQLTVESSEYNLKKKSALFYFKPCRETKLAGTAIIQDFMSL